MFCATSALGISWKHLNHTGLLLRSVYRFHVYFDLRIILHYLGISSLHEIGFSRFINSYIKIAYYNICDNYDVNVGKTWMNEDWFYTTKYGVSGDGRKTTERSPADNLTR